MLLRSCFRCIQKMSTSFHKPKILKKNHPYKPHQDITLLGDLYVNAVSIQLYDCDRLPWNGLMSLLPLHLNCLNKWMLFLTKRKKRSRGLKLWVQGGAGWREGGFQDQLTHDCIVDSGWMWVEVGGMGDEHVGEAGRFVQAALRARPLNTSVDTIFSTILNHERHSMTI